MDARVIDGDLLDQDCEVKALRRTRFGSRVICDDKALLFEEAPQAYKPVTDVIAALVEAGVATVVAETSPLLTYKTRRDRS